jgi:prevent-host-death family protein
MPKSVTASEFKANCLALIDEAMRTGDTIAITRRGKPFTELVPHPVKKRGRRSPFEVWKGKVEIVGDIVSPIYAEWARDIDAQLKKRRARND